MFYPVLSQQEPNGKSIGSWKHDNTNLGITQT
jgi:hypothetical protein